MGQEFNPNPIEGQNGQDAEFQVNEDNDFPVLVIGGNSGFWNRVTKGLRDKAIPVVAASAILYGCNSGNSESNIEVPPFESITPSSTSEEGNTPEATNTTGAVDSEGNGKENLVITPTTEPSNTPDPTSTPEPTPTDPIERIGVFKQESGDFNEALATINLNSEAIEAIKILSTEYDFQMDPEIEIPQYEGMSDYESSEAFKKYIQNHWQKGSELVSNGVLPEGILKLAQALRMTALIGSSPYLSDENVDEFQKTIEEGRRLFEIAVGISGVEQFRDETKDYYDNYFFVDNFLESAEKGKLNSNFPIVEGVNVVRGPLK